MQNSINKFQKKLDEERSALEMRLNHLSRLMSKENATNLNDVEQQINAIHFFRSIGYADTHSVFYYFQSYDEIKEVETELTKSIKYLTSSHIEFESFVVDDLSEDELDSFHMKCEQEYILWFTRIWHSAGCHKNSKIKFILIENNSGKSFDLNAMKWVNDAFENQNSNEKYYSETSIFNDTEAMNLILTNYEY